jgi:small subunit ribosomal protein S17e
MRRIQRGPVRGISFKLQEEERERKENTIPESSAINVDRIEIDPGARAMLNALGMSSMPGIVVVPVATQQTFRPRRPQRD